MKKLMLLGLLFAPVAQAIPVEDLEWRWAPSQSRRWYVENHVLMPGEYLFVSEKSRESRLVAFQTEAVLRCDDFVELGRRKFEVMCVVEDFAIRGVAAAGDNPESTAIILEAIDRTITGATVQLRMGRNGRVLNVDLEGVDKRDRRRAQLHDVLRIVLGRLVAGFDLQLPRNGRDEHGVWPQFESRLMAAPTSSGSGGAAEVAHLVRSVDDGQVVIETAGRGMVNSREGVYFESTFETVSVFDAHEGLLRERMWVFRGEPTASTADRVGRVPYDQRGRLLYLPDGAEPPVLGPTAEVEPPGESHDSAILDWGTIGGPG